MYNVYDKSDVFYFYDYSKNSTALIGNKNDLIKFLARGYESSYGYVQHLSNKYFDNINMGNDIYHYVKESKIKNEDDDTYQYIYTDYTVVKQFMFFDGFDRIIDVRMFKDEVFKYYNLHKNDKIRYSFKFHRKMYPTSHAGFRYKHTFLHNRIKVRKMDSMFKYDDEYKDYHFKRIEDTNNPYPDWFDDKIRRVEGNWKSQYKVNKQHNIHNKGKSDDSIRKFDFDDFTQDEIDEMLYEDFLKNFE